MKTTNTTSALDIIKTIKLVKTFIKLDLKSDWKSALFTINVDLNNKQNYNINYNLGTKHVYIVSGESSNGFTKMFNNGLVPKTSITKPFTCDDITNRVTFVAKVPSDNDILQSIFCTDFYEETFIDFCEDFTYDNDSIAALDTFNEIVKRTQLLKSAFTGDEITCVQDYINDLEL